MKLFLCGAFAGNIGPGIANQNLKDGLGKVQSPEDDFFFSKSLSKVGRVSEIIHIIGCKAVVICSVSAFNKYIIVCAKLLHIKIIYIVHGLLTIEKSYYDKQIGQEKKYEEFVFRNSDKIVAVSSKLADLIIDRFPYYSEKVEICYNCIPDIVLKKRRDIKRTLDANRIISIGGTRRQKCMIPICEAVEKINKETSEKLELIIIGKGEDQIKEVKRFSCVKYIENLPHDNILSLLSNSRIYIQNSEFESFGMAIVEALSQGCDLLMSSNIGSTDLFSELRDKDIIINNKSVDEIASKIMTLLEEGNWEYLNSHFSWEMVKPETAAKRIISIINKA